ncbi:hypothetical protein F2P56_008716 [Juglans regia]|uniref:Uncharacterized protein LOC109011108 n=2 Tax=Juglans regia TaxID=51240 RepID=A0A2I4GUY3_JUGRE|nr:uncharacterized protein LOC109011108 [Juglans regia]XP_018847716.2 uncharacterized protein LOC109011108 [Juglans regia]KAF5471959.1 hypothetical protein F2P56_008716 [Juglans regia]
MEVLVSPQGQKQNLQAHSRKSLLSGSQRDLWLVVQEGSLADVDLALALLKKNGGNINLRNVFGLTPLHIATWRNHIPIVRRLLAVGADPDARDGESGWSSLHRALHFGHLAVASILLQSGASITLEDSKGRMPVDLLSGPVLQVVCDEHNSVTTEVYSWGSGANYQLGTGNEHIQKLPCKVDTLHGSLIMLISAAKFHSVAVSTQGEVYTWGFGRGGRLGHPDFDIHSGQAAVITPRQVTSGLGSRRVRAIAAAKHHTVAATEGGEVFTWGSNREGQLGYTSVDTQPTPRRVSSLKSKIVAVAAANKHTAVVSATGEVFTWGCNREGQLGYGTSNSASNYTPRVVEYLKGKFFKGVAAAKYHTVVLGADGEVYTWGHRLVTPQRVVIARNLKKCGNTTLKFHRMERLHVVAVAVGMVHSVALTDDGALFYWVSSDPGLRCHQLYSLCGRNIVSISAGKYWTAAVTATGDVYMWDGKNSNDKPPIVTRLHGVKKGTSVSVGETHMLIVGSLYHPVYPPNVANNPQRLKPSIKDEAGEFDDLMFDDVESNNLLTPIEKYDSEHKPIPSLKGLCEKVAAECLVEPRNAIQLLEIADSLEANDLKKHCEEIAIRNLDYIFTVSSHSISSASLDILANLEKLLDLRSSEPWSYRRLPTPTATFPAIINSEEDDSENEIIRTRDNHTKITSLKNKHAQRLDSFLQPKNNPNEGICKQVRALRKKLQQIEMLEGKQSSGHHLDDQQIAKLQTKSAIQSSLAELGVEITTLAKASSSVSPDGKGNKRAEVRKQRRRSAQRVSQVETTCGCSGTEVIPNASKDFLDVGISQVSKNKEEGVVDKGILVNEATKESTFCIVQDTSVLPKNKTSLPMHSKKKNKKGGLSMFLSGALDDTQTDVAPPPTPRSEGPAWGGPKIAKGCTSLREIQDEQSKIEASPSCRIKDQVEDISDGKSDGKILLSSFLPSNPIPMVVSGCTSQASDEERSTPHWAASGTPPHLSRPSLRDIQKQQKGKQQQQSLSHSPKTRMTGFSVATGPGSPSDPPGLNRWFKPEVDTPSSIRSIQIEEKAMKDLKRFYSSVKIVKNQS